MIKTTIYKKDFCKEMLSQKKEGGNLKKKERRVVFIISEADKWEEVKDFSKKAP